MPAEDVHGARLTSQLLSGPPASDVVGVVDRLLAVQAQDLRAARLAVRARSTGLHRMDVDAALDARALVVSWLNRGTLHLARSEDYPWLQSLTAPGLFTTSARRLAQEGVSPEAADRGVAAVLRGLADGPRTRTELREVVQSADVPVAGQALVHVLWLATLRGHVVRGPMRGTEQAFVQVDDWLGRPAAVDREEALGRLAHRYLRGHGPASDRDLAVWSGLSLGEARRGLMQVGDRLVERDDGLLDLRGRDEPVPLPPPRLLGGFEPLLLGWTLRADVVGPHRSLVTTNGIVKPFALVGGRAVATWGYPKGRVALTPLEPLDAQTTTALDADAQDVQRFQS